MRTQKTLKELKRESREIEKKITLLQTETRAIESKGCFSDQELDEREKKINAITKEVRYLDREKKFIMQDAVNIEREKWLKRRK